MKLLLHVAIIGHERSQGGAVYGWSKWKKWKKNCREAVISRVWFPRINLWGRQQVIFECMLHEMKYENKVAHSQPQTCIEKFTRILAWKNGDKPANHKDAIIFAPLICTFSSAIIVGLHGNGSPKLKIYDFK